nr:MAG TPA: SCIMP protein [Caudoviricetes sp.]
MTKNSERLKLHQIIIALIMLVVSIGIPLILLAVVLKLIYYVLFVL